jgi:putative ATPase
MKDVGYGNGYSYAHDFEQQTAPIECLPESLAGRRYYKPKDSGLERQIRDRLEALRAAREEMRRRR